MNKLLSLILLVTFISFKTNAQNITVENGAVKFNTIDIYEQYAENKLNRNDILEVSKSIKPFISNIEVEEKYPDFLQTILNSDNIFVINNFIIRMDLENDRAFVVSGSTPNAYEILQNSTSASDDVLMLTSSEDYALHILEALENKTLTISEYNKENQAKIKWPWNSCSGAKDRDAKRTWMWGYTKDGDGTKALGCIDGIVHFAMDNKLVYQAAIFYFSIQSKSKSLKGCGYSNWIGSPTYDTYQYLNTTATFATTKNCKDDISVSNNLQEFGSVISWRPYEGGRALTRYKSDALFGAKYNNNTPANFIYDLPQLHIEYGY